MFSYLTAVTLGVIISQSWKLDIPCGKLELNKKFCNTSTYTEKVDGISSTILKLQNQKLSIRCKLTTRNTKESGPNSWYYHLHMSISSCTFLCLSLHPYILKITFFNGFRKLFWNTRNSFGILRKCGSGERNMEWFREKYSLHVIFTFIMVKLSM